MYIVEQILPFLYVCMRDCQRISLHVFMLRFVHAYSHTVCTYFCTCVYIKNAALLSSPLKDAELKEEREKMDRER